MMAPTHRRSDAAEPQIHAVLEAHCQGCGHWLATLPAGPPWIRLRCHNRRCDRYRRNQTIRLAGAPILPNREP